MVALEVGGDDVLLGQRMVGQLTFWTMPLNQSRHPALFTTSTNQQAQSLKWSPVNAANLDLLACREAHTQNFRLRSPTEYNLTAMARDPVPSLQNLEKPEDYKSLLKQDVGDDCMSCRLMGTLSPPCRLPFLPPHGQQRSAQG